MFKSGPGFLFLVQTGYFPVFQSLYLHCWSSFVSEILACYLTFWPFTLYMAAVPQQVWLELYHKVPGTVFCFQDMAFPGVIHEDWISWTWDPDCTGLIWVERHVQFPFPCCKLVEILLEYGFWYLYRIVVCEELCTRLHAVWQVVDKQQKY